MTLVPITEHLRERVILWARGQIGKKYAWLGSGPNAFDCSGLTMAAWGTVGVVLPHNSTAQSDYHQNPYVNTVPYTPANTAKLQFGDLVFYYPGITHVAISNGVNLDALHKPTVVQATDEELGVQQIEIDQYAVPVGLGFMGHS